jgi:uncharacterized membrane protein (UPF0127 family)
MTRRLPAVRLSHLVPLAALVWALGLAALASAEVSPEGASARPAGTALVIFGADTVVAEVAQTPEERQQGLMYREHLDENAGMLFVFDRAEERSFWMQNTYIPLDIAYLDSSMRIINIVAMEPLSTELYESEGPALFALETNQGWFEARGIGPGAQAIIEFGR